MRKHLSALVAHAEHDMNEMQSVEGYIKSQSRLYRRRSFSIKKSTKTTQGK